MHARDTNILVVVLDTVRARNLSCYGYERKTTPFLESFADTGIKFEYAYAPSRFTTPSHASLFTGAYPSVHQTDEENRRLTPDLPTLAEELSDAGYETVGFSNNIRVSEIFGYDRGFEYWEDNGAGRGEPLEGAIPVANIRSAVEDYDAFPRKATAALRYCYEENGSLTKTVYNWVNRKLQEKNILSRKDNGASDTVSFVDNFLIERDQERPFFAFLNLMEGHTPFAAPDEFQYKYVDKAESNTWEDLSAFYTNEAENQEERLSELVGQYDGAIRYLDSVVERLVSLLESRNLREETTIIITSDHGESFGEHGHYGHAMGLYNELTHVPLLIDPAAEVESSVIEEPVSIQWLMPTLLNQLSIPLPNQCVDANLFDGSNDRPVLGHASVGAVPGRFSSSDYEVNIQKYLDVEMCVSDGYKLLNYPEVRKCEIFDIDDETEGSPLTSETDPIRERLLDLRKEELKQFRTGRRSDIDDRPSIDNQTRDMLSELGYVD